MNLSDLDAAPDGAVLLNELHGNLTRYVILPSPETADAVTLYIAATHAQPAWEHASRLVVKSPQKRCGKTRLMEVCRETVHQPKAATNISPAALARQISDDDPPTILLDEADTVFGSKKERREGAEDIRGILNSGHSRGWPYVRWDAAARRTETCTTFAMAIIGGIGDMPDTVEDRAVVISMERRAPGQSVTQWRSRRAVPVLRDLRDRLHAWVLGEVDALGEAEPELPAEDRAADVWEPLVAIADAAGGTWPERARQACKVLTGEADQVDPDDAGVRLLSDLREVFAGAAQLPTAAILEHLAKVEEAPWATWHRGDRLSPRALAGLLRPYKIRSKNLKIAGTVTKGYTHADMVQAWSRYLPLPATKRASAQVEAVADEVADEGSDYRYPADQPKLAAGSGVAEVAADPPEPRQPHFPIFDRIAQKEAPR